MNCQEDGTQVILSCAVPMAMPKLSVPSQQTKIVNKDCTLLSDDSNKQRCSKSYRSWSSPCYANHLILDTDLQSCLYTTTEEDEKRKRKGQKAEAERPRGEGGGGWGAKKQQGPSCLWRGRSESRRTEKNLSVRNKRSTRRSCRWLGGSTLRQSHKRQNRGAEITVVQGLMEVVTSNFEDGISSKESEKHSQRKARS